MNNKDKALGMSHGSAVHKLRKKLLFDMANRLGLLKCHQCGAQIASVEEFSIEHKVPWQKSMSPKDTFFDLSNIAFSHLSCNARAADRTQFLLREVSKTHCPKGHAYDKENTLIRKNGWRRCRLCHADGVRRSRNKGD
jgi:hypothetical protein